MNDFLTPELRVKERIANHLLETKMQKFLTININKYATVNRSVVSNFNSLKSFVPDIIVSHYSSNNCLMKFNKVYSQESITNNREKGIYKKIFIDKLENDIEISGKSPLIFSWQEDEELQNLTSKYNGKTLSMPSNIQEYIEDKLNLKIILKAAKIESKFIIKSCNYNNINELAYINLKEKFGNKFVIQRSSSGGKGTFIVKNEKDFNCCKEKINTPIKISQFINGKSFNNNILNVCINNLPNTFVDQPSIKPMMENNVTGSKTTSIGHQWFNTFSKKLALEYVQVIEKLGKYLYKTYGLIGLWGIDTIWDGDSFKINEINCRIQGSTEVSSINQILRNELPFIVSHYSSFLDIEPFWLPSATNFNNETVNIMLNGKRYNPFYLKVKLNKNETIKNSTLIDGIYRLNNNNSFTWVRNGITALEANWDNNEFLIVNSPLATTKTGPNSMYCTIEGIINKSSILNNDLEVSESMMSLIDLIRKQQ